MTSMACILGVVPLVIATDAASRHSIGIGVFGGMLAATFLAVFFVPLFFVLIRSLSRGQKHRVPPPAQDAPEEPEKERDYQHA
jgi:HAE1 family hydrophobic/amphiphilic exporter-1/multidrug efflux pump